MNSSPRISVIVVNYNGMSHLHRCIASVLNQNHPDFEVVLVDNSSSDGSLEHVRSRFPQITYVENTTNLGYAGGVNSGLPVATGEYIVPLNMDAEMAPGCLSTMASFLDSHSKVGAINPKLLLASDHNIVNAIGLNIHITGLAFCRHLGKTNHDSSQPHRVTGVSGCCYMIRRGILDQMGGLPQECFMANDDVVTSWFVTLLGFEMYAAPSAVVYHQYDPKLCPEKLFLLERNREAMLLMCFKPFTLALLTPLLGLMDTLVLVYCACRGRRFLQAKLRAWHSLIADSRFVHSARERRSRLQGARRISDLELLRQLKWNIDWPTVISVSRFGKTAWGKTALPAETPPVGSKIPSWETPEEPASIPIRPR